MNTVFNSFEDVKVFINGKIMTLRKCSLLYNIDYDLLVSEYIETGDINKSITNAYIKMTYLDSIKKYMYSVPVEDVKKNLSFIHDRNKSILDHKKDVTNYAVKTHDSELELSSNDIISLLVDSDYTKPIIPSKYNELIDRLINFCSNSDIDTIKLDKSKIISLIKILNKFRISNEDKGRIYNIFSDKSNEKNLSNIELDVEFENHKTK